MNGTMPLARRGVFVFAAASLAGFLGSSLAASPFEVVKGERPLFKPEQYFAGRTHSWGVFESRSGAPTRIIQTQTKGRWKNGELQFEQDLQIDHAKKMHRSWTLRRVGPQRYAAVGTGIVGTARGEAHGNAFHLEFTLDALPGNPLGHVRMYQWMYLQPDGVTMLNRARLTKAGVVVAEITEQFRKDR
jgi:hypothetical protein